MNLWKETIEILKRYEKTFDDVLTICGNEFQITKDDFKKYADTEYNAAYGAPKVAEDLRVIGVDFWLERHEYDGSEWWAFKEIPNYKELPFKAITALTVQQCNHNIGKSFCGWKTLSELNEGGK